MNAPIASEVLAVGLLETCEKVSPRLGWHAFRLWTVAQTAGWQVASRRCSRSSWYHLVRVLKAAGVVVPDRSEVVPSELVQDSTQWFGVSDPIAVLARAPGRIAELADTHFRVVREIPCALCGGSVDWPIGAEGLVCELVYRAEGWRVVVEFFRPAGLSDDIWRSVDVFRYLEPAVLLRHAVPLVTEPEVGRVAG